MTLTSERIELSENLTGVWTCGFDLPIDISKLKSRLRSEVGVLLLVPMTGVEPVRYRYRRILSPVRLPIPSHRLFCWNNGIKYIIYVRFSQYNFTFFHKNCKKTLTIWWKYIKIDIVNMLYMHTYAYLYIQLFIIIFTILVYILLYAYLYRN